MTWSDNVQIISPTLVANGSLARGTLDLRTSKGAFVHLKIGRTGTAAMSAGCDVIVRPMMNNGSATLGGPSAQSISFLSQTTTASLANVNTSSAAGAYEVNMTSVTGFASDDYICIYTSASLSSVEFQRVSKTSVAAGVAGLTTDSPLLYTYPSASTSCVTNRSDVYANVWLDPGATYEILFDMGNETTSNPIIACAKAQVWTN